MKNETKYFLKNGVALKEPKHEWVNYILLYALVPIKALAIVIAATPPIIHNLVFTIFFSSSFSAYFEVKYGINVNNNMISAKMPAKKTMRVMLDSVFIFICFSL